MMKSAKWIIGFFIVALAFACSKELSENKSTSSVAAEVHQLRAVTLTENFETGTKTAYTTGSVTFTSGSWTLNDALLGTSTSDRKNGLQSVRVRNSGKVTMNFNKTTGIGAVTVLHALYGTDAASTWGLWYSTDGGVTYVQSGASVTSSSTTLTAANFTVNAAGNVRLEIRKTDASTSRICFDDVTVNDYVVSSGNPIPGLASISPSSVTAGASAFTLTVTGSNFINGSTINWNGSALTTTFVSASSLTASVSAALVSTAGSASVTVVTAAPGGGTTAAQTFTINPVVVITQKKFLFDAKHQETAGNADWVIDEDNSTPQRIPTPAQSTITSSTSLTYWTGAISSWGISLVKLGHYVETLPTSGTISYGNTANAQDLANFDVFVVCEPNSVFTASEKIAMLLFVQNGGSLLLISNHNGSDRNNDGWDSPQIWNDFMTNNSIQSNPFGFSMEATNISQTSSNIAPAGTSPVLTGSQGNVTSIQFSNGGTMTLNPTSNPNVKGLIWQTGASGNSGVMCATSTYGNGRVFMLGDSSCPDDGSGAPNNLLFNGWGAVSHSKLLMNASLWCAKVQ